MCDARNSTTQDTFAGTKKVPVLPKKEVVSSISGPSKIFYKAVRGWIPHQTKCGQAALARLRVLDGISPPYGKKRRVCVRIAMRVLTLRSDRKYCQVGRLSIDS